MGVIISSVGYPFWKRTIDIFGALTGLFIITPFAPIIALAILLEDGRPFVVRLERVSGGETVTVYKFRSMVPDAKERKQELLHLNERNDGPFFKLKEDPRVTRTGRVLRKFRVDEFPQLVNVLRGELSLVGPRPHEPEEVVHYPEEYKPILAARAGVTGFSQVNGASSLPFLKELELDKYYVENMSPLFDARIVLKTLAILFFDPTAV